jgi:ribosomal protein L7/L12
MFSLFSSQAALDAARRLKRIEEKLDMLLGHLGLEYHDPARRGLSDAVRGHLDAGRKIEAIKLLREETGVGLREAKDAVDNYERHR